MKKDLFPVIVLLLLIIGALVFLVISFWPMSHPRPSPYNTDWERIMAAVAEFMIRPTDLTYNHTTGEVPIVNKTVIAVSGLDLYPDEDHYVIAICSLLVNSSPPGILKQVPQSVHPRNCLPDGANAQPNVTDCAINCTGSYVWLTTDMGDVTSICIGAECEAHGEDGYQGVYP